MIGVAGVYTCPKDGLRCFRDIGNGVPNGFCLWDEHRGHRIPSSCFKRHQPPAPAPMPESGIAAPDDVIPNG